MTLEDELSELSVADTEFLDLMNLSCRQLLAEICEVQNLKDRRILLKDALFNPEIERTKTWSKLYGDFLRRIFPGIMRVITGLRIVITGLRIITGFLPGIDVFETLFLLKRYLNFKVPSLPK